MKIATFILLGAMALPSVSFADLPITGVGGHGFQGHRQVSFGQTLKNMFNLSDYNKSYAVVVGVSQYNGGFDKLNSARNDAKRMKDFLIGEAGFDYVHMLTESQVTHESLRRVMDRLSTIMKSNDRFLFYWSGHGVTRKVSARDIGYLPLINSKEENYGSMLRMSALKQWDDSLDVKQALYIVDACFSGLAGTYDSKASKRNLRLSQVAQPSRQILTAGQTDEITIASSRYKGSLFTTAVIEALGGSGDLSGGFARDGVISASELKLAVQDRINAEIVANPDLKRFKLTPTLKNLVPSRGDFFFLSNTEEVEKSVIVASNEKAETKGSRKTTNGSVSHFHESNQYSASLTHSHPGGGVSHPHRYAKKEAVTKPYTPPVPTTILSSNAEDLSFNAQLTNVFKSMPFSEESTSRVRGSGNELINRNVTEKLIKQDSAKLVVNGSLLQGANIRSGSVFVNGSVYGDIDISSTATLEVMGNLMGDIIKRGAAKVYIKGRHVGELISN